MPAITLSHAQILLVALLAVVCAGCAARTGPQGEPLSEDERIAADVRDILRDQEGIVPEDIEVEVRSGVVVLSGVQPALEPVSEALQRIARVRGVLEVVNRIRIQQAAGGLEAGPSSRRARAEQRRAAQPSQTFAAWMTTIDTIATTERAS